MFKHLSKRAGVEREERSDNWKGKMGKMPTAF